MKVASWLGWLILGCLIVTFLGGYGKRWDLSGRYGMPTTLLSPDGQTYRDGSPIDGVTLAFAKRGIEQGLAGSVGGAAGAFQRSGVSDVAIVPDTKGRI